MAVYATILPEAVAARLAGQTAAFAAAARDAVFRGMADAVRSAQNHFRPEARATAERAANTVNAYGNVAKLGDVEETSALKNLFKDLNEKHGEDVDTPAPEPATMPDVPQASPKA